MYKIVKTFTIKGMEDDMNSLIEKGWTPLGGLFRTGGMYYQAVYKSVK